MVLYRFIFLVCLSVFSYPSVSVEAKTVYNGRVVKIIDGDTYDLLLADNKTIRIRMYGIDAPERAMPFYQVSKKYLGDLCFQQNVKVIVKSKDHNGRIVAYTYLGDGRELSHEMIKAGLAWHYKKYSDDKNLAELEKKARLLEVGLWREKYPVASWVVRQWNRKKISTKDIFANMDLRRKASELSFL